MIKGKILPKLVLFNTRLVVGTYTAVTLPFYAAFQRPWIIRRQREIIRTKVESSNDGSYHFWKRHVPTEVVHPFRYDKCETVKQALEMMRSIEDLNTPRLSYRTVYSEDVRLNENGKPMTQDGKVMKATKLSDQYQWLTIGQVFERVEHIMRGLSWLGLKPRQKMIIFSETRLEWFITALSLMELDAVIVTLFSNLGKDGLIHGMKQTEAKFVMTTFDLLERIAAFIDQTPNIEKIVYIRHEYQKQKPIPKFPDHIQLIALDELESIGSQQPKVDIPPPNPDSVSLIMYTSGTTGIPKAVILHHRQVRSALVALASNVTDLIEEGPKHVYASFLPMAHIMGLMFELFLFTGGVRIGYSSPHTLTDSSPAHIAGQRGDLNLLQPTVLICVPLILDRIIKEIYSKLSSRSPILPPLFTYLMDYKIRWTKRGYGTPLINRLVCKRVQEQFGGRLKFIISGGAPLNPRTEELIRAALDIHLMQGYGCTETTGGIIGMPQVSLDPGKAGYPLDGVRLKLESWPEGGYTPDDKPNPRGEILVGGDSVAQGYYKLEDETKDSFSTCSDGIRWFHTGDIGEIFPNGTVKVIDRKKDLAKLPNGEYISLGKIESSIKTVPLVENVCICVSSKLNDLVALITPNEKQFRLLAQQLEKTHLSRIQLCSDQQVIDKVLDVITQTCLQLGLHRREIPVRIRLTHEEWLPDNDLLTAAFKLKRRNVLKYYAKDVEQLFSQIQR